MTLNPIVTKNYNGSLTVSDIINNQYIKKIYIGYSEKQAISLFRKSLNK